jgi:hypothetical protein
MNDVTQNGSMHLKLEWYPLAGSCGHINQPSTSIKGGQYIN